MTLQRIDAGRRWQALIASSLLILFSAVPAVAQWGCCFGPPPRPLSEQFQHYKIVVVAKHVCMTPDFPDLYDEYQEILRAQAEQLEVENSAKLKSWSDLADIAVGSMCEALDLHSEEPFVWFTEDGEELEPVGLLGMAGKTTCEISWIAKGPADIRPGHRINIDAGFHSEPGKYYVLFGVPKLAGIEWAVQSSGGEELLSYLQQMPTQYTPREEQLRFYFSHLESSESRIGLDALNGLGELDVTDSDLQMLAKSVPLEQLRQQFERDAADSSYRRDYVAEALSYVGDESDARKLMDRFWMPRELYSRTSNVKNFLRLRGAAGLDELDQRLRSSDRKFTDHKRAYLLALKEIWSTPLPGISKERLKQSVRLMLSDHHLAGYAILQLARWSDWTQVDRIASLYRAEKFDRRHIRRAIISYLVLGSGDLSCVQQRRFPLCAFKAAGHLNRLRQQDRQVAQYAMNYLTQDLFDDPQWLLDFSIRYYRASRGGIVEHAVLVELKNATERRPLDSPEARAIEANLGKD